MNYIAEDSECTAIVLDGVLRKLPIDQVAQTIALAYKKLRIGGILKIVDIDFDLLVYVYGKSKNLASLNQAIFAPSEIRSFLSVDLLKEITQQYPRLSLQSMNIQNIEFDAEFKRNG
jgi:predicted SAM-dependent methyltransferase